MVIIMKKVIVRLENFCKSYENKEVIKDSNLEVYEGEFLTLLGSSGCGKTTILRAISVLDPVTSGKIYINEVDVTNLEPQERGKYNISELCTFSINDNRG